MQRTVVIARISPVVEHEERVPEVKRRLRIIGHPVAQVPVPAVCVATSETAHRERELQMHAPDLLTQAERVSERRGLLRSEIDWCVRTGIAHGIRGWRLDRRRRSAVPVLFTRTDVGFLGGYAGINGCFVHGAGGGQAPYKSPHAALCTMVKRPTSRLFCPGPQRDVDTSKRGRYATPRLLHSMSCPAR